MLKRMKAFSSEEHEARLSEHLSTPHHVDTAELDNKNEGEYNETNCQAQPEDEDKSRNAEWRVALRKSMPPR